MVKFRKTAAVEFIIFPGVAMMPGGGLPGGMILAVALIHDCLSRKTDCILKKQKNSDKLIHKSNI
jgi:hypothetical protein